MLIDIGSFLVIIPAAILCLFPMKNQLKYPLRRVLLRMALLFLVIIPGAAVIVRCFSISTNTVLLPMLILLFIIYHFSLTVPIAKSLAVFFWITGLMAILANYANGVDAILHPGSGADINSIEFTAVQFGVSIIACLFLYWPVSKYGSELIDRFHYKMVWYMTMPFSLLFLGINLIIRPVHYETLYLRNIFTIYWSLVTSTMVMWLMLSMIFYIIVSGALQYIKTSERNRFLEMQESQFISQQQYMEESARARHDFKQMIRTLREMMAVKDYDGAEEFLRKYAESLPENEITHYCSNTPLNALLNYYAKIAADEGIELNLWIELPDFLPMSDVELCGMIGNILENGISACRKMKEGRKWIQLTILLKNGNRLYIVATNSFNGEVRIKDGQYFSTNRKGRGLGLESITSTVERFNGSVRFSHSGGDFYTDIVIPISERDLPEQ